MVCAVGSVAASQLQGPGLILSSGYSCCCSVLNVFLVSSWVSFRFTGFFPLSKTTQVGGLAMLDTLELKLGTYIR